MSRVRNKDTKIEILLRSKLHKSGFRFRKNLSSLPGKPDIVLPKYKTVIFVHGCFWHQHEGCRKARRPTTRVEFWDEKLDKNVERDKKTIQLLKDKGWQVLIAWECELMEIENLYEKLISKIESKLRLVGNNIK